MTPRRHPEIDRLKGLAILFVVCIHSRLLEEGSLPFDLLINRAVPIFFVLFGYTAELWWASRSREDGAAPAPTLTLAWYTARLRRLAPPVWGAATVWWLLAWLYQGSLPPTWVHVIASYLGYSPWEGQTTFLSVLIVLILFFPLLRRLTAPQGRSHRRLGLMVALSAVVTALSVTHWAQVVRGMHIALMGSVPTFPGYEHILFSLFVPVHVWPILGGVALARLANAFAYTHDSWPSDSPHSDAFRNLGLAAVGYPLLTGIGLTVAPSTTQLAQRLADIPLTLGLLSLFRLHVWTGSRVATALEWMGRHSLGIYIGQMVCSVIVNLSPVPLAAWQETPMMRLLCAGYLLTGGVLLTRLFLRPRSPREKSGSDGFTQG